MFFTKTNMKTKTKKYLLTSIVLVCSILFLLPKKTAAQPIKPVLATSQSVPAAPKALPETPEPEGEIRKYIKEVFGKDYDKAMLLLTSPKCHENLKLDPAAVSATGDVGLFQINRKWQGFNEHADRFLKDYKINTRMAYVIYHADGDSFKLWTCGRANGI